MRTFRQLLWLDLIPQIVSMKSWGDATDEATEYTHDDALEAASM